MKNAGKACNNRLYRHIRTFEKIIKNYFVIYYNKYKQNKDRKLLFYFGCMAAAFAFNFIAFIVSAM